MLYNIDKLASKAAGLFYNHEKKREIIDFFVPFYLAQKGLLQQIYVTDNDPFCFIDQKTLQGLGTLAEQQFNLSLDMVAWYEDKKYPLLKREEDSVSFEKFEIKNANDFERLKQLHSEYSHYGKEKNKDKEKVKDKKKEKKENIDMEVAMRKEASRKELKRKTSLSRDFDNSKIVSVDFEFRYLRNQGEYKITEVGLTTFDHGNKTHEHYLVKENYEDKLDRSLQDKFLFGRTEFISINNLSALLMLKTGNADYLLFHEQREDMEIFKQLNVDINKKTMILDTQVIYNYRFKPKEGYKAELKTLLDFCNIKTEYLHNAGNDANYTLELFFKMVEINKALKEIYLKSQENNEQVNDRPVRKFKR